MSIKSLVSAAGVVALMSTGLVGVSATPALAVGCTVVPTQYTANPGFAVAVAVVNTPVPGTSCTDSLTVPADVASVSVIVVGGGGGAGGDTTLGGGGGAGGVVDQSGITVAPGQVIPVTVGSGGAVGSAGQPGSDGLGSTLAVGSTTYAALGGGGGGASGPGRSGGSGGGGGGVVAGGQTAGGAGTQGGSYSNPGVSGDDTYGGGGGGASAVGAGSPQEGGAAVRLGPLGDKFSAGGAALRSRWDSWESRQSSGVAELLSRRARVRLVLEDSTVRSRCGGPSLPPVLLPR